MRSVNLSKFMAHCPYILADELHPQFLWQILSKKAQLICRCLHYSYFAFKDIELYSFTYSALFNFILLNFSGTLIWKAIPLLDKSERFSVTLPNAFNFSFSFAWFLRIYLFFLVVGMFICIDTCAVTVNSDSNEPSQRACIWIRISHLRSLGMWCIKGRN